MREHAPPELELFTPQDLHGFHDQPHNIGTAGVEATSNRHLALAPSQGRHAVVCHKSQRTTENLSATMLVDYNPDWLSFGRAKVIHKLTAPLSTMRWNLKKLKPRSRLWLKRRCCKSQVEVRESRRLPTPELELAANAYFPRRAIVLSFPATKIRKRDFEQYLADRGLDEFEDCGFGDFDSMLTDATFDGPQSVPDWYRLNHSWFPSLEMKVIGNVVVFVALRNLHQGDELTFKYGDPDARWSRTD